MAKKDGEVVPTSTKDPVKVKVAPYDREFAAHIYVAAVAARPGSANAEQLHQMKAQAIMAAQVWGDGE